MLKRGLKLNVDYRLRTPNSYQLKTKSGKWGMIAYSNEINSVMIGYKRGRFTGAIDSSGWVKESKKWEELQVISHWNELAFRKANTEIYEKQKRSVTIILNQNIVSVEVYLPHFLQIDIM